MCCKLLAKPSLQSKCFYSVFSLPSLPSPESVLSSAAPESCALASSRCVCSYLRRPLTSGDKSRNHAPCFARWLAVVESAGSLSAWFTCFHILDDCVEWAKSQDVASASVGCWAIELLGCWAVGLLAKGLLSCWAFELLGYWAVGLLGCWWSRWLL